MDADMVALLPSVGVEALIEEISRDPGVDEVHVRHDTHWVWTRHLPDPDDPGIRYGIGANLSIVGLFTDHRETEVARLILEGDAITHIAINRREPYGLVTVVTQALGIR